MGILVMSLLKLREPFILYDRLVLHQHEDLMLGEI